MGMEEGLTLSSVKMVRESWKLLWRSRKQMLPILLMFLLPYTILVSAYFFYIIHLVGVVIEKASPMPQGIMQPGFFESVLDGLKKLTIAEMAILLASILLSSILNMAVIYTVAMALKEKEMTLKDLQLKIWKMWKGVMVTKLYVLFMANGYFDFSFLLTGAVVLVGGFTTGSKALATAMSILVFLLAVYMELVWFQGIVVSVLEDRYGLAALGRASDLIQERRSLGFIVNLLMNLFGLIFNLLCFSVLRYILEDAKVLALVFLFVICVINLLIGVFKDVIYVVFYYKCSDNQEKELLMRETLIYNRVSSSTPVPEDLP